MMKQLRDLIPCSSSPVSRLIGLRGLNDVFSDFDKFLEKWPLNTGTFAELQPKAKFPKVNVSETDEAYEVDIAVAGFDKEEVDLELKDNCLFIKANKGEETSEEGKDYLLKEISSRSFRRVLTFPKKVLTTGVSCTHNDGIIKCILNKEPEVIPEDSVVKIKIN